MKTVTCEGESTKVTMRNKKIPEIPFSYYLVNLLFMSHFETVAISATLP